MRRNLFALLVLVAISMPFTACGLFKGDSITGPSDDDQPPDQSRYEPLPATHQFVDGNGQPVKAWATLNDVNPLRGTTVAKHVCPANVAGKWCFSFSARVWIDDLGLGPNINHGLNFKVKFSDDGVTPRGDSPHLGGGSVSPYYNKLEWILGGNGAFYPIPFAIAPKFLLFDGEYWYSAPKNGGIQWTLVRAVFELDYR